MGELRARLTFANVVSVIALILALGLGSAWAATELSRNDVKSRHIARGAVKTSDLGRAAVNKRKLAPNSVHTRKVRDGSLRSRDFAPGELPAGPKGDPGPRGEDATNLLASVGSAGNLIYGQGVSGVSREERGNYEIDFDRDLTNCVAMANSGVGNPGVGSGTAGGNTFANAFDIRGRRVEVFVLNTEGFTRDQAFTVAVFCP